MEPALKPTEWERVNAGDGLDGHGIAVDDLGVLTDPRDLAAAMAYANHRLPDDDPRKITRLMVYCVQQIAQRKCLEATDAAFLRGLANVLDALLPPE